MAFVGAPAKDAGFQGKPEGRGRKALSGSGSIWHEKDPIRRYIIIYKNEGKKICVHTRTKLLIAYLSIRNSRVSPAFSHRIVIYLDF